MYRHSIAAVVGVCDEISIIDQCIIHLESQKITYIVVVDMASRDGTRERLRELEHLGRIALIERDNDPSRDQEYLYAGVEYARKVMGAEWILIHDADEFCISFKENVMQALCESKEKAFLVERYNACLCNDLLNAFSSIDCCPKLLEIDIWIKAQSISRAYMDTNSFAAWSSARPPPKVIAQAASIKAVASGGHGVIGIDNQMISASTHGELMIVHVPFLSVRRFRAKVSRIRELLDTGETYFSGETGWHWRRWVEIDDCQELAAEYNRQFLSDPARTEARRVGAIATVEHQLSRRSINQPSKHEF